MCTNYMTRKRRVQALLLCFKKGLDAVPLHSHTIRMSTKKEASARREAKAWVGRMRLISETLVAAGESYCETEIVSWPTVEALRGSTYQLLQLVRLLEAAGPSEGAGLSQFDK